MLALVRLPLSLPSEDGAPRQLAVVEPSWEALPLSPKMGRSTDSSESSSKSSSNSSSTASCSPVLSVKSGWFSSVAFPGCACVLLPTSPSCGNSESSSLEPEFWCISLRANGGEPNSCEDSSADSKSAISSGGPFGAVAVREPNATPSPLIGTASRLLAALSRGMSMQNCAKESSEHIWRATCRTASSSMPSFSGSNDRSNTNSPTSSFSSSIISSRGPSTAP
mmetsp:Transcript_5704/g.17531  ORF Transcript_5704/g.17531 Transcript_5704/m.17531 type:complete len:223 (+) Transcript_5704:280-948(+)